MMLKAKRIATEGTCFKQCKERVELVLLDVIRVTDSIWSAYMICDMTVFLVGIIMSYTNLILSMFRAVRYFCSVYSNIGTTVRYRSMQSCSKPFTYFGLFRQSSGKYSTKKNTTLSNYVMYLQLWSWNRRVGTLIVATIYLQLIQNRYMFRGFTVLHCSHQHCVQPVSSDMEVVGYL